MPVADLDKKYDCNYCKRDLTGAVRIKCAVCRDFDLCLDCFSVGVEIHHHENNQKHCNDHAYYVMVCCVYPCLCPKVETQKKKKNASCTWLMGVGRPCLVSRRTI